MPKKQKMWIYSPPKPKITEGFKIEANQKAGKFIESVLKPKYVKSPPAKDEQYNYIVDIYSKWYRGYFYFCAKYHCPHPNAIKSHFEIKFARMEFIGNDRFALSYMRHTEQWWEIYPDLTLEQCLKVIEEDPLFQP
jgi:hypothetical protein